MTHPSIEQLADYWLGEAVADAFEEHLFACGECSRRLDWLEKLSQGIRKVVREGDLAWVLTPEFLTKLEAEGLRVRIYAPENGDVVQCTITDADDLLMGRLRADFSRVSRLDVQLLNADGTPRGYLEDIAFLPGTDTELLFNQPVHFARTTVKDAIIFQLLAVDERGTRTIAEYRFEHSVPPPAQPL